MYCAPVSVVVVVVATILGILLAFPAFLHADAVIQVTQGVYSPTTVQIAPGEIVRFSFAKGCKSTASHGTQCQLAKPMALFDFTYTTLFKAEMKFDKEGTYGFFSTYATDCKKGMQGTIVVKGKASGSAATAAVAGTTPIPPAPKQLPPAPKQLPPASKQLPPAPKQLVVPVPIPIFKPLPNPPSKPKPKPKGKDKGKAQGQAKGKVNAQAAGAPKKAVAALRYAPGWLHCLWAALMAGLMIMAWL